MLATNTARLDAVSDGTDATRRSCCTAQATDKVQAGHVQACTESCLRQQR